MGRYKILFIFCVLLVLMLLKLVQGLGLDRKVQELKEKKEFKIPMDNRGCIPQDYNF